MLKLNVFHSTLRYLQRTGLLCDTTRLKHQTERQQAARNSERAVSERLKRQLDYKITRNVNENNTRRISASAIIDINRPNSEVILMINFITMLALHLRRKSMIV